MKYLVGINLDSGDYECVGIDRRELIEGKENIVIVYLGIESNYKLADYYNVIKQILNPKNMNRVILLTKESETNIYKQISMLCVMNGAYDIYSVENVPLESLNADYLNKLIERKGSIDEIQTFIGADIAAYDEMSSILADLEKLVASGDTEAIQNMIADKQEVVINIPYVIDYLKAVVDNHNSGVDVKLKQMESKLIELQTVLAERDASLKTKVESISNLEASALKNEQSLAEYRKNCKELEERLANSYSKNTGSSGKISRYKPLDIKKTSDYGQLKSIIYFKEISPVHYIKSFIKHLIDYTNIVFQKDGKDKGAETPLKIKVVVYDRPTAFGPLYKGFDTIDGATFNEKPGMVKSANSLLVTEPVMGITEAILKGGFDIVIIYDKLKDKEDLVTGSLVSNYYVIANNTDYNNIKNYKSKMIFPNRVITNDNEIKNAMFTKVGTKGDAMSLTSMYFTLNFETDDGPKLIYNTILRESGINIGEED